jgi:hypothetical protein
MPEWRKCITDRLSDAADASAGRVAQAVPDDGLALAGVRVAGTCGFEVEAGHTRFIGRAVIALRPSGHCARWSAPGIEIGLWRAV